MLLWITFALLTGIALIALLRPLGRAGSAPDAAARPDYDMAVYRDQLAEIAREREEGTIGDSEAEAARNEIARRMLAADAAARGGKPRSGGASAAYKAAVVAAMVAVPAVALGGYLWLGRPGMPDVPHAARMATALERQDFGALVYKVERHLASNPEDVRGWRVLAPAYRRLGRLDDAANAYGRIVALSPPDAGALSDYGTALVEANDGLVTAEARKAFSGALAIEPGQARARYYMGLAAMQDGREDEALTLWRALLADAPAEAPWRGVVEQRIASLQTGEARMPQPDGEAAKAIMEADPEARQAMIEGMVDRLARRLEENGDDLEGWLRLARARSVLGDREAAADALDRAAERFAGDETASARIETMRAELGLGS